jgi:hypothetical protein
VNNWGVLFHARGPGVGQCRCSLPKHCISVDRSIRKRLWKSLLSGQENLSRQVGARAFDDIAHSNGSRHGEFVHLRHTYNPPFGFQARPATHEKQLERHPLRVHLHQREYYGWGWRRGCADQSSTAWLRKPPFYPAFAEYTEAAATMSNAEDTSTTRQQLHSYVGRTTILDTRVTCQAPTFDNLTISLQDSSLVLTGFVRPRILTPRMGNQAFVLPPQNGSWKVCGGSVDTPVPFARVAAIENASYAGLPDQWRTSLCQLTEGDHLEISGGLVSEFKDYSAWTSMSRRNASQTVLLTWFSMSVQASERFGRTVLVRVTPKLQPQLCKPHPESQLKSGFNSRFSRSCSSLPRCATRHSIQRTSQSLSVLATGLNQRRNTILGRVGITSKT